MAISLRVPAQGGLSLIETLITLVVLSVGLLGVAGLQLKGIQQTQVSQIRSQAILQAEDMIDRMHANREGIVNGNYDRLEGTPKNTPPNKNCSTGACSAADIALLDHLQWDTANRAALPGGAGVVCHGLTGLDPLSCSGTGDVFSIVIYWDEDRTGATGKRCDASDPDDMQCLRMNVVL